MEVATTPPLLAATNDHRHDLGAAELGADANPGFEDFYRANADRVRRALAVTLGDPEAAGEAVDEAMTRALARWRHVRRLDSPAGWVYRVGLNWSISRWRRLRREIALGDHEPEVDTAGADTLGAGVAIALQALPVDQRAVIVCRALLECSTAETAASLGIPEGTVKSRLARGLTALRAAIDDAKEEA